MTAPASGTTSTSTTGDGGATGNEVESKGLKGGALGLLSSIVVGVASTAPAYSLAASLGLIVASGGSLLAGVKAPAIVLIAFIPMYLIAVAYQELNKAEPDCGTKHHLHMGQPRIRPDSRLDRRLGDRGRRRDRDGQPGPDRRLVLLHLPRRPRLALG
ncbi:hypothetical protein GCM10027169_28860 [Gordonia jinhuaensis]|uniref:Amino acid permease n=1 Tax=Gordonia jinhuaensis TaxID=1517702 RepID=A0A916WWT3_9ACTN|nr:hypothetical protein GCM10011489_25820 [Gordonia jinhuaensis]